MMGEKGGRRDEKGVRKERGMEGLGGRMERWGEGWRDGRQDGETGGRMDGRMDMAPE